MATVRLFNPPRATNKRRKLFGAALAAYQRKRGTSRTTNRKRNAGQQAWVANFRRKPSKRRNRVVVFNRPRSRANPKIQYRYKRRNPSLGDVKTLVESALYAGVGGVLARSIPGSIMTADQNSGLTGYAANAATGVALSFAVGKLAGENAGKMVLIGAAVQVIGRIVSDKFGQNLVSFGQVNIPGLPKLSGDPAFNFNPRNMRGEWGNVNFKIPYNSTPVNPRFDYNLLPSPTPAGVPAAAKLAGPWGGGRAGWIGR